MPLPLIAITTGDPAGIGPEIAARTAADARVRSVCVPELYHPPSGEVFTPGVVSAAAGRAAYDVILRAVADARSGRAAAIATAPINKAAFAEAGLSWRGHTDLLAHLCGASPVAMMFHSPKLRVVLATVHVPLRDVSALLTLERVSEVIELTARELPRFGIARPRLAVAGVNPHAGEGGLIGREEVDVLAPAVSRVRERGVDVAGPFSADTIFARSVSGEFDAVIAAYHDQGLIPVKLLAFGKAINVTLGLPIIRTSVDHGTAFDIAGQGRADPESLIQAVLLAAELAARGGASKRG